MSLIILLLTNYNLDLSIYLFVCFYFSSERHISFLSNKIDPSTVGRAYFKTGGCSLILSGGEKRGWDIDQLWSGAK